MKLCTSNQCYTHSPQFFLILRKSWLTFKARTMKSWFDRITKIFHELEKQKTPDDHDCFLYETKLSWTQWQLSLLVARGYQSGFTSFICHCLLWAFAFFHVGSQSSGNNKILNVNICIFFAKMLLFHYALCTKIESTNIRMWDLDL